MEVDPIRDEMTEEDNENPTEWIEATDNQDFELTVFPEETDKFEPFNEMSTKILTSSDGKETDKYEHRSDIQTEVVVSSIKKPADNSQQSRQTTTTMPISSIKKGLIMYLTRVTKVQMAYLFLLIRNHPREMKI